MSSLPLLTVTVHRTNENVTTHKASLHISFYRYADVWCIRDSKDNGTTWTDSLRNLFTLARMIKAILYVPTVLALYIVHVILTAKTGNMFTGIILDTFKAYDEIRTEFTRFINRHNL